MEQADARTIAQQIASGHAYVKHVVNGNDFPEIKSQEELADLIADMMTNPSSVSKHLRDGRQAFWNER